MNYILDTNICIYIIKRKPQNVLDKLSQVPLGLVGISVITLSELVYGVRKSAFPEKNMEALKQFLIPFELFQFDYNCAIEYGYIRSDLEKKGALIGPLDMLIAAHAKSLGHILVTNNEKEFKRIEGLQIENWVN
ncbi:MAG TPA: type II toxin-antitoxin system VapC family toxin [Hanamia sp.]|jgi:Predicted nucleic acid-binding protein, contains PIN domain|nr:type II toxin-antitoxin system VapC family toxin [Hanamia sp.]